MRSTIRLAPVALFGVLVTACSTPPPDPDDSRPSNPASSRGGSGASSGDGGSGGGPSSGGGGAGPSAGQSGGSNGSGRGGGSSGAGGQSGGGQSGGPATGGSAGDDAGPATGGDVPMAETGPAVDPLPPGVQGHPSTSISYPKHAGFTLALVEEFDTPLDLDKDPVWTWSDGGLPEGAVRFFKDAISFAGGKMILTATKQNAGGSNSYAEPVGDGPVGFVPAKPLHSGEMRTKFNNYRYGRYEVRMKPPTSGGNFISTMFVFRTPKFINWREIDIELTADRPRGVVTNMIRADNVGAWNESIQEFADGFPNGPGAMGLPGGFSQQSDFHTYAFEWLPDKITWFVDDQPIRVKTGGRLPVPERSAKIIMNLWIFASVGGFGGDPTRNAYPMTSEYEWFRFYKWDQEDKYPCTDLPNCLPGEDRVKSKNNPDDGLQP